MKFGELHEYMTKSDTESLEQSQKLLADIAGSRLIVIAGGGHTAILRNLAQIDTNVIVEDVLPYLQM